jgi:fatty acid desaturase
VCAGVTYMGWPLSELGPRVIRPPVFLATLSYFATFVLASRELGVIQGQRQQGYYSKTQRRHRAIAWMIIAIGASALLLGIGIGIVILLAIGLRHSNIP